MPNSSTTRILKWALPILLLIAFFPFNETLPGDIMECRNLVTAREMEEDGHWLVPTMNGNLRLEKPPLPTWIAGAVETLSPDNLALQRSMAGLAACLLVIYFYLLIRKLHPTDERYALYGSFMLLCCYNIVQMGRLATWDIYCHAFMMAAIYYLFRGLTEDTHLYRHFILAGLLMGLSFLSKGPVSFYALLLPCLLALPVLKKATLHGRWGALAVMIVLCLVVSTWWYVYILFAYPDLAQQVIHKESGAWVNHNVRPWHYYLPHLTEVGVWSLLLITSLIFPLWHNRMKAAPVYSFGLLWMLLQLFLLSLLPEKKPRYLLPMMMPCCLTMVTVVMHWVEQAKKLHGWSLAFYRLNAILLSLIPLAVMGAVVWAWKESLAQQWVLWVTAAVMLLLFCWDLNSLRKRRAEAIVLGTMFVFAFAELVLMPTAGELFNNPDRHSIAATRTDARLRGIPFYYNEQEALQIEIVYYARRTIRPISLQHLPQLPCALVTEKPITEELSPQQCQQMQIIHIDRYNDSTAWRLQKHKGRKFQYYVTLLKPLNR